MALQVCQFAKIEQPFEDVILSLYASGTIVLYNLTFDIAPNSANGITIWVSPMA